MKQLSKLRRIIKDLDSLKSLIKDEIGKYQQNIDTPPDVPPEVLLNGVGRKVEEITYELCLLYIKEIISNGGKDESIKN